jgi:hypothetical protein
LADVAPVQPLGVATSSARYGTRRTDHSTFEFGDGPACLRADQESVVHVWASNREKRINHRGTEAQRMQNLLASLLCVSVSLWFKIFSICQNIRTVIRRWPCRPTLATLRQRCDLNGRRNSRRGATRRTGKMCLRC